MRKLCIVATLGICVGLAGQRAEAQTKTLTARPADAALIFVIDRSGSMSGAKIANAKQAINATVAWIPRGTVVAVIAFDNQSRVVVPPTRAGKRAAIKAQLSKLSAGGGTNIYPALRAALTNVVGIRAKKKHVILLSDGQSPYTGVKLAATALRKARATVSTIALGSGADVNLLGIIAKAGAGRFYKISKASGLPRLFKKETAVALKR